MSRGRGAVIAALGGAMAAFFGLRFLSYDPEPIMAVTPSGEQGRKLEAGEVFTVLNWNLQYSASRKHNFFYDGGSAVRVPESDVVETLRGIREVIHEVNADLVFLQEVDRGSDRTARIDQLDAVIDPVRWPMWVSVPYHRSGYVPHPLSNPMGRVDMHLAVLSRFAIDTAERVDLPRLEESWIRRVFNLKRALLAVEIPVAGEEPLWVGNTHLSAFSHGDGTMGRQMDVLQDWMGRTEKVLLAGDFNLLPPGDDPSRLVGGAADYADAINPLAALASEFAEVSGELMLDPSASTYLPFGAQEPDRKIDYVFHGQKLEVLESRVLSEYSQLSDHLPIWAKVRLRAQ